MIDRKIFETLAHVEGQNCISIFIPTYRAGQEQEDRIRYKNALSEVHNQLVNNGLSPKTINAMLTEAKSKIDDLAFWQDQSDGLAIFIYNGITEFHALPVHFSSYIFVGDHLYLKPLLPLFTGNGNFFLLAISQKQLRFFSGEKYAITELETRPFMPNGMRELMQYIDGEPQLQQHSGNSRSGEAIFHGQGGSKAEETIRLREYLRLINRGVMEILCADDTAPLIVAAVEETAALYRQENDYPHLHPKFIPGNPDHQNPAQLHEKVWALLQPEREEAIEQHKQEMGDALAGNEASFSMHDIIPAAIAGRVKTLFVAADDEIWGVYQQADHTIRVHEKRREDSIPLINEAAVRSFLNGGTVYVLPRVELPRPTGSINAIYRYAKVPV